MRISKSRLIDFELFLCQHFGDHDWYCNHFLTRIQMAEEDFDIDSLASYLHLTPSQVRKMADRDRLPGRTHWW